MPTKNDEELFLCAFIHYIDIRGVEGGESRLMSLRSGFVLRLV